MRVICEETFGESITVEEAREVSKTLCYLYDVAVDIIRFQEEQTEGETGGETVLQDQSSR